MSIKFEFGIPNSINLNPIYKILICAILSFIVLFRVFGMDSLTSLTGILSFLLLGLIFFVIISTMTSENLSNELPSTLYPAVPHTGLDGISLNSYINGMDIANNPAHM